MNIQSSHCLLSNKNKCSCREETAVSSSNISQEMIDMILVCDSGCCTAITASFLQTDNEDVMMCRRVICPQSYMIKSLRSCVRLRAAINHHLERMWVWVIGGGGFHSSNAKTREVRLSFPHESCDNLAADRRIHKRAAESGRRPEGSASVITRSSHTIIVWDFDIQTSVVNIEFHFLFSHPCPMNIWRPRWNRTAREGAGSFFKLDLHIIMDPDSCLMIAWPPQTGPFDLCPPSHTQDPLRLHNWTVMCRNISPASSSHGSFAVGSVEKLGGGVND